MWGVINKLWWGQRSDHGVTIGDVGVVVVFVCPARVWRSNVFSRFLFMVWKWELRTTRIIFWLPLHIRVRAAEGLVFTVELLRRWWSQSADLIFWESGQNHHSSFYSIEQVRTVFQLWFLDGSFICRGNGLAWEFWHIFCKKKIIGDIVAFKSTIKTMSRQLIKMCLG